MLEGDKMSSLTDMIERTLLELIDEQDGCCVISRNAFASELQVAPSQITYVITTRFTHRHGYLVESRRGGSGYVRITRVPSSEGSDYLMHLARSVPERLSQHQALVMVDQLGRLELISDEVLLLMKASLSDASLRQIATPARDRVRSDLFRQILIRLAAKGEG
jgi:transcriptional regulator CtsR